MNKREKPVSASEIGSVTYCPRKHYLDQKYGYTKAENARFKHTGKQHDKVVVKRLKTSIKQDKRCYIATHVYGSDHPNTVLLRRWRDYVLRNSVPGRLFITTYYFISPWLIKSFGSSRLFNRVCTKIIDRLISVITTGRHD